MGIENIRRLILKSLAPLVFARVILIQLMQVHYLKTARLKTVMLSPLKDYCF